MTTDREALAARLEDAAEHAPFVTKHVAELLRQAAAPLRADARKDAVAQPVEAGVTEPLRVMQHTSDDCMRACLATYFGCGMEETPPLDTPEWTKELRVWAAQRGYGYVTIAVPNEDVFKEAFSGGMLICSGQSVRGRHHAVIYKDGELWHDPHPDSSGIKAVEQADFFYPLMPAALRPLDRGVVEDATVVTKHQLAADIAESKKD